MITLVLGGSRSGKSAVGEALAAAAAGAGGHVTYLATAVVHADDPDLAARVAEHVRRRPPSWSTTEIPIGGDLAGALRDAVGVVLLDSLGPWVAGFEQFAVDATELVASLQERARRGDPTVVVSEEVGLGVHPATATGRRFRDVIGSINQAVAAVAGTSMLAVAGLVVPLVRLEPARKSIGEP